MFCGVLLAVTFFATGQGYYPDAELREDRTRYEKRIDFLLEKGFRQFLGEKERVALANVRVELPLRGANPLEAFAHSPGGVPTVVFPVLSLRFIEDLCLAYAWRYTKGHSLEPIDEYLAMIKYRKQGDFPGGRYPDPLQALGVPPNVWEQDPAVDELSLRFRNTAWAFLLAHELAHLRFGHPGNRGVDPRTSQRNEAEADAFAVDLMGRSGAIPMGALLWFQASVAYFPNRADFDSDPEYRDWVRGTTTHPINSERLKALGSVLERSARKESDADERDVRRFIARRLERIGEILSLPDMQRLIVRCALTREPALLKRLDDRACDQSAMEASR